VKAVRLDEYCAVPNIKLQYLIHKLIPKPGRVMIVGPPKVGKSRLALQIAMAIGRGESFLGRKAMKGKVLYLEFDTPGEVWQDAVREMQECGVDLSGEVYFNDPSTWAGQRNIFDLADRTELVNLIEQVNPDVVIVDALRKLFMGDENDSNLKMKVWQHLNNMTVGQGRSLIVVHHAHKLNPELDRPEPSQAGRGSSFDAGEVEATLFLWRGLLTCDSRLEEAWAYRTSMNKETGLLEFPQVIELHEQIAPLIDICAAAYPTDEHITVYLDQREAVKHCRSTYTRLMRYAGCPHHIPVGTRVHGTAPSLA